MASNLTRRHPLVVFYMLAFAISWLGWVPQMLHGRGLFPFDSPLFAIVGGLGPTLAAVIVVWVLEGRSAPKALFAALLKWRVPWPWFVFVFAFWFVALAAALGVATLWGHPFPPLSQVPWGALPAVLVVMLLSNVWEEIGWRGFALPRFQSRFGDLATALIMGALWELWHVPLALNPASPMSGLRVFGPLFPIALTVIYTWLYNQTRGSLLFVTLFHAMSNTVAWITLELDVYASSYPFVVGVTTVVALLIVLFYGPRRFAKPDLSQAGE